MIKNEYLKELATTPGEKFNSKELAKRFMAQRDAHGISESTRRVDLVFGISYTDEIPKTEEVLMSILKADPRVLEDPEPTVQLAELGDSSVNFNVRPWVKTEDYWPVYWDITREVKIRFDAEGIGIPFPQRDVHHYFPPGGGAAAPMPGLPVPALAPAPAPAADPATAGDVPPGGDEDASV